MNPSCLVLSCLVPRPEEFFQMSSDGGYKGVWLLPLYHPFHFFAIFFFFTYVFVVPLGYYRIFKLIHKTTTNTNLGLNERYKLTG